MTVTMVFDLETVPDVQAGRRLLELPESTDAEVAKALFARRAAETQGQSQFLPHYLHQIAAISVVVSTPTWVKVWSLGDLDATEPEILRRFFEGIDRYTPNLVSWNGAQFDLPVLHYRSMLHSVEAPRYWETGEDDPSFKWNNYLSRYHQRHLDLMDVLAGYQGRAFAPLDELSVLLGFPGKMGMAGAEVWEYYQAGQLSKIRDYCETDVLNTYLIFLRFQHIRGHLNAAEFNAKQAQLQSYLQTCAKSHFLTFLNHWQSHE